MAVQQQYLSVPTADQETQQWEFGRLGVLVLSYEMREHMSLQVVDLDERYAQRDGEAFGKGDTDEKRAKQSRTAGECHRVKVSGAYAGTLKSRVDDRHYVLLMST